MPEEGIWVENPITGDSVLMRYSEMEQSMLEQLIKPIGGFCWRASEFMQIKMPAIPFYVKDWLPMQGKAMVYAPMKSGKSFMSIQMARCIGAGAPFIGIPTTKGSVLYCQSELGAGVLQGRMHSTGKSYDNVFIGTTFSMKLDTTGGRSMLHKAMEATEPNVLILDPLYKMVSGDLNESKDMTAITDFLDELIEVYNCSILIIHHPGKDLKKGGLGSSILGNWVDSGIEMKKTSRQGEPLKVKLTPKFFRHAELPPKAIEVVMKDFEFETIGDLTPTIREEVAEVIKTSSLPITPKELFSMGIGTNASVYSALNKLIARGAIERVGRGRYGRKGGKDGS